MNNEIKHEILMMYDLAGDKDLIYYEAIQRIIDYIADLEQENEKLKNIISSVKEDFLNANNELTNLQEELEEEKRINQEDLKLIDELQQKIKHYEETITFGDYVKEVNLLVDYKSRIEKATNELFELKDMIYKPETRDENIPIQQKISSIIKQLNGRSDE